ncbi:FecR family protein [Pseudomonas sp. 148P]|uniref:FecR family protein n=1 Tax=Pseudomonas ulcerans TaxID=3115852 RepID=A0ABU7HY61_9PSED|nr:MULTISPECIES: FecR family protein [unclassified Pseudomonas]MEE1924843.1 FecR family protein [Pseudomonas sp. 147P]MEE1936404.1 FecR family protein [Pseudomonas sp. 148P]
MPDAKPHSTDLHATAQHWVVLLTSGDVDPADIAAARAWCAESPAHQQAFVEARRLWQLSGHLQAPLVRRRPAWPWATAAVLLIALGLGLVRHQAWDADYRTAYGEQQRIQLADGSHILLDSDSALDVSLQDNRRAITLRKGEALFEVAHDPQRPFQVQAGDLSATALGTVYAVRKQDDGVQVTVAQGRVAVNAEHDTLTLGAGEQVDWRAGAFQEKHKIDTGKALAWQHGRLVFEMAPLADVLAELQRYRPGYLLIGDDSLRTLKVSGTFRLDRLDDALATLEQAFPLRIQRYTGYLLILRAR